MIEWFQAHPFETAIIVANVLSNAFRMTYPVQEERPKWVRFCMALIDPVALNFWTPVQAVIKPKPV